MTDDPNQDDDETPGLRHLLDKMHGDESSLFDELKSEPSNDRPKSDTARQKSPAHPSASSHTASPTPTPTPTPIPNSDVRRADDKSTQSLSAAESAKNQFEEEDESIELPELVAELPQQGDTALSIHMPPLRVTPPENMRHELERIPVTLEFSLRTLNKTLGEVSKLQEGEIIPLGCGTDGAIDLKANGRVFAVGRLVMVEEQLAVEITKTLSD